MHCKETQKNLSAYLDNEMSRSKYNLMSIHLSQCADCSHALDNLKEPMDIIKKVPDVTMSNEFNTRLAARISEYESNRTSHPFRLWPALAPLSAMALIVLVIFFNVVSFTSALSSKPADVRANVIQKVTECFVMSPSFINAKSLLNYCSQCHMTLCSNCQTGNKCEMSDCRRQ